MSNGSTFPPRRRFGGTLVVVLAALLAACAAGWLIWRSTSGHGGDRPPKALPAASPGSPSPGGTPGEGGTGGSGQDGSGRPAPDASDGKGDRPGTGPGGRPGTRLQGKTVLLDPGHNIRNRDHTREIARRVDVGNGRKECDTTGTSTDDGYAEADFTLDVARRARTLLRAEGAKVVFTQDGDRPYGPCVDERARAGNAAKADAAVSVHADGAGAGNRGFHVILPARVTAGAADTSAIVGPSRRLGEHLAGRFVAATGSAPANYLGGGTGLVVRSDLGGLNLSGIPKVFLECGNMRDAKDAAQLTDPQWREKAARGIAEGITGFLTE
ncbi:N-acetylmuramoyl-L-alanine amidase [Streptomyces albofaciens JCM 4342]|uniref:N-acetylmuramoyl-L-alanine amidase n=1 Tax=Streptomyces albofaciens TaxID=66866 RepID=UPI00123A8B82|nr:N-acetylmuramoyl-L-alanine amidase [Streptomyces albofaciens]KAA6222178.1 N-acetylmuramoyl-L-alanine amidase [Streptomyces albofaciens JCM 4342]